MSELLPILLTLDTNPPSGNRISELYLPKRAMVSGSGYKSLFSGFFTNVPCVKFSSCLFRSPRALLTIDEFNGSFFILFGDENPPCM